MNLVTLQNVSKQYSERLLFQEIDLLINSGDKIGLIGANGSGKTTLLKIIAQLESPGRGLVTLTGKIRIRYLSQEPQLNDAFTVLDQLFDSDHPQTQLLRDYEWTTQQLAVQPNDMGMQDRLLTLSDEITRTNSWEIETKIKAILTKIGIIDFGAQVATLSGGQRRRVALAQALIDQPDLLILDEPTNHIDTETIAWLESYLANEVQSFLIVTHDRYFLDRAVNQILDLDRRKLVSYPGNYTRYLELKAERDQTLRKVELDRQRLLKQELAWLRRGAQARSTKQKARIQRVEQLREINYDHGQQVWMPLATRRLGKQVLTVNGLSHSFGDKLLFRDLSFALEPGERVGILGPNGVGKSTLLNILTGKIEPQQGSIQWGETVHLGYYDQQSEALLKEPTQTAIQFIERQAPIIRTKDGTPMSAANFLEWFQFPRPQQQAQVRSLSGGERRRLYLLYVLMHQPNVLILDEPTNDLDLQMLNVLEAFLDQFTGSLIVVSHDRYFLDRTVDYLVSVEAQSITARYPSPYESYQRIRAEELAQREAAKPSVASKPSATRTSNRPRKLSWKESRELEELEQEIEQLESDQSTLQATINEAGSDYQALQTAVDQLQAVEDRMEQITERWLELSEIAEQSG